MADLGGLTLQNERIYENQFTFVICQPSTSSYDFKSIASFLLVSCAISLLCKISSQSHCWWDVFGSNRVMGQQEQKEDSCSKNSPLLHSPHSKLHLIQILLFRITSFYRCIFVVLISIYFSPFRTFNHTSRDVPFKTIQQ